MGIKFPVALALSALLVFPAAAQPVKVLKGSEITESAVVEGLSPEEGVRMRSFKVKREGSDPDEGAPSVSMLITFQTNSASLTHEASQSLNAVGQALSTDKLAKYSFRIEGHADPRGGSDLNQRLSQARAETVREYLVQNKGIDGDRLMAIGKGDRELLDKEHPAAPENRRVTIVTIPK